MKKLLALFVCLGSLTTANVFADAPLLLEECDDGKDEDKEQEQEGFVNVQ